MSEAAERRTVRVGGELHSAADGLRNDAYAAGKDSRSLRTNRYKLMCAQLTRRARFQLHVLF